ncbi:thermonuclease family protein [Kaustia mangrovi]|uniref:Thermonuclease family protein n=2 Tax=Kaustia mangrovi TaxID=2593653 RepID=A0A7S8C8I4_9HYPH|nr:thermonuclease family protein [Kaustia mangrovi]
MRLLDIDTPEISKPRCKAEAARGYQARDRLRQLVASAGTVEIVDSGDVDRYDRRLVWLMVDGEGVGRTLMSEGLAVEWRPGPDAWRERRRHWCGF